MRIDTSKNVFLFDSTWEEWERVIRFHERELARFDPSATAPAFIRGAYVPCDHLSSTRALYRITTGKFPDGSSDETHIYRFR